MTQRPQNRTNIARLGQDMLQNEDILCTKSQQLDNLRDCLLMTPAVELKGMALLRGCRPDSGFFPTGIPRDALIEAITEITAYTERAQQMAAALMSLTPIPLCEQAVLEYGL